MNQVHLIGKMSSMPQYHKANDGRRIGNFNLSTKEIYFDEKGNPRNKNHWHKMQVWGKALTYVEEMCSPGMRVAVEGKLITRFYQDKTGKRNVIAEVEVNEVFIV